MKLFALTHFYPDFPDIIEAECAVSMTGFHPGSSELSFNSDRGDLTIARMRLLRELEAMFVYWNKLFLKSSFIVSAQRLIENQKAQVVMCVYEQGELVLANANAKPGSNSVDEQLQVVLCGKPRETVLYIYQYLCTEPFCEMVEMSASQFSYLNDNAEVNSERLQQEYGTCMSYNSDECQVAIQGFCHSDVKAVARILGLYSSLKPTSFKTQILDCSKNEAMYLNHILLKNPTDKGEELLAALQAEFSTTVKCTNNRILLEGPAASLDSSMKRITDSSLLKGLQSKLFNFNGCSPALLISMDDTFRHLEESHAVVIDFRVKQENVDATLLSNNEENFETVCQALQVWYTICVYQTAW